MTGRCRACLPIFGCFSSRQIRASLSNFWWSAAPNKRTLHSTHILKSSKQRKQLYRMLFQQSWPGYIFYRGTTTLWIRYCIAQTASQWRHMRWAKAFFDETTSWSPSWKYGVISEFRCMHIYSRNNRAKFHPDPIWNDFFQEVAPTKRRSTKTSE